MNGLILAVGMLLTAPEAELAAKLPDIFAKSAAHYRALDAALPPLLRMIPTVRASFQEVQVHFH